MNSLIYVEMMVLNILISMNASEAHSLKHEYIYNRPRHNASYFSCIIVVFRCMNG